MSNLILNLTGVFNQKKEINPELAKKIYVQRLKINNELKEVELYGLAPNYSYIVRGGSDISGCSINSSLNTNRPKKIYVKKSKKFKIKKRFLPNCVNEKIRVIDLYVRNIN